MGTEELYLKIREKYGEEAEKIVRDRPWLTEEDITNYDIFNKDIISLIGYGGVHSFLNYNMSSSIVISELAKNSELLQTCREFFRLTEDFYPPSAIGLDDKLNAFYQHKDLIGELIKSGRQDELRDNLLLYLADIEYRGQDFKYFSQEVGIAINKLKQKLYVMNVSELEDYPNKRKIAINEAISEIPKDSWYSTIIMDNIIKLKYFGNINKKRDNYNSEKFLQDYLKFNSVELSESDIDLVEVYSIFLRHSAEPQTLQDIDDMLDDKMDIINPLVMKRIDQKVAESYRKEYVESLLTVDEIKKYVNDPNNPSELQTIYKKNGDELKKEYKKRSDGTIVYRDNIDGVYEYKLTNGSILRKKGQVSSEPVSMEWTDNGEEQFVHIDEEKRVTGLRGIILNGGRRIEIMQSQEIYKENLIRIYLVDGKKFEEYQWCEEPTNNEVVWKNVQSCSLPIYRTGNLDTGEIIEEYQITKRRYGDEIDAGQLFDFFSKWREYKNWYEQSLVEYAENIEKNGMPIIQYDSEKEMVLEDGDIPSYVLYNVDPRKLCISMLRGITSEVFEEKLKKNGVKLNTNGFPENIPEFEKYYEGGLSTRSCYYRADEKPTNTLGRNGFGMSSFNPNDIIGFSYFDAHTAHGVKLLDPIMYAKQNISYILDGTNTVKGSAEIALQRYKYDIRDIHEGDNGGRVSPSYICNNDTNSAIKLAKEFNVPMVSFEVELEKQKELDEKRCKSLLDEREPKRQRKVGDIVLQVRKTIDESIRRQQEEKENKSKEETEERSTGLENITVNQEAVEEKDTDIETIVVNKEEMVEDKKVEQILFNVSDERLSKKSSFFEKMRSRFLKLFNRFTQKKLPSASTKISENIVNEDEKKNEFKRMINANNTIWRTEEAQRKVIEQQLQASKDTSQNRDNNDGFEIGD